MNNFQIVFRNTFFLTLSEFFLKLIGVMWVIYLAHALTVSLFGRYNFVNAFIAIFSLLPDLGIGLIVIREIAAKRKNADLYLGSALVLNGGFALLTLFAVFLSIYFLGYPHEVTILIIIATITLFLSTLRSVGIFYFDGIESMHHSALLNSLNMVLFILFGFLGFQLGYGLSGIFLGMLLGTVISLIVTWMFVLKKHIVPRITFNFQLLKYFFHEALPLGLAGFAYMVYTRIDTLLLNQLLGEHAVGIYSAATPFGFALIQLLNVPFVVAVYPALSRIKSDNKRFERAITKSLLIISLWSFSAACIISLFASFIPYIFGSKYHDSIPVLRILIFFVPFASLSALLYKVLIIVKKQYLYLAISLVGVIVNILLNIFLIPKLNITGAAWASVLTQAFLFGIYFIAIIVIRRKL